MRILVVEDSREISSLVTLLLTAEHHDVTVVREDFPQLLDPGFDWTAYDAVICDIVLPDVGGMQILRHARDTAPQVRRLAFTAGDEALVRDAARISHVVLRKGDIHIDQLIAAVTDD